MTLGSRIEAVGGFLCIYCMIPYGQMTVYEARTALNRPPYRLLIATSNHFVSRPTKVVRSDDV